MMALIMWSSPATSSLLHTQHPMNIFEITCYSVGWDQYDVSLYQIILFLIAVSHLVSPFCVLPFWRDCSAWT